MTAARASAAAPAAPPAPPVATLADDDLLRLWEHSLHAPRLAREDRLLQAAGDVQPPRSLGLRNAALLAAHARWFGTALALQSRCPSCAEVIEYGVDSGAMAQSLIQSLPAEDTGLLTIGRQRLSLRAPDADDIAQAEAADGNDFANALLAACITSWQQDADARTDPTPPIDQWPQELRAAALARIEDLDPAASVGFDLHCPACGGAWLAPLDPGTTLWQKVQAAAERLLQEIDLLARAYGWRESEILALSPLRRAAYLQMVQA